MKNKLDDMAIIKLYYDNINFLLKNTNNHDNLSSDDLEKQIIYGSIKLEDILALNKIININPLNNYLEIGSYVGFSFFMFMTIFQFKHGTSIDPNIKHRSFNSPRDMFCKLNTKFIDNKQITLLDGFFAGHYQPTNKIPIYTSKDLNMKYDCIFIDGDHDYKSVQRDFLEASKVLTNKGIIILHDIYSWSGVMNFCVDLDKHLDWSIIRTPKADSIDGFGVVTKTENIILPQ
jgi:predicted O-methyltransferase YrrM